MDTKQVAEKILNLTLETIFFLTGEDYIVVKKQKEPNKESVGTCISEGICPVRNPIPTPRQIHDGNILALTHTIVHLLTGEVLNRCKDVSFGFSAEDQLYQMENQQSPSPLGRDTLNPEITRNETIPECEMDCEDPPERGMDPGPPAGGSSNTNSPLSPGDLYAQESLGEENKMTQEYKVKQEEGTFPQQCDYEQIPTEISTGQHSLNLELLEKEYEGKCMNPAGDKMQPALLTGECSNKNSPLATPRDLYVQESLQEENRMTQEYQVKQEDVNFRQQCNDEQIPTQIITGGAASWRIPRGELHSISEFPNTNDQSASVPCENSPAERTSQSVRLSNNNFSFHEEVGLHEPPRHQTGTEYSSLLFNVPGVDYVQNHSESRGRSREKPYVCSKCGKGFAHKSTLVKHQSFHMGDFTCSQCGKSFNWKSNLLVHERSHAGQKPFACSECGKCFAHKSTLVKHQLFHMGAFTCSECGKGFSQKSNLLAHQRRHTGHKPFSCFECGRCFSQNSSLITHQRIHTGEKPFACSECGKCYTQYASLLVHHRTHTGEKPYVCSECGKAFNQMAHLVKHQRSHKP
ncbi:zinc finger protein 391 isoform X1 [Xenopus laevis]|uniref:Zinc finger protein 391 isoform X1 n=2 Tax=Xenopus laevis TaxID=8355 RepID=A0A8J1MAJ0_XENLA|nr:zinc finger protein 391 isoform X1 [Xenopus laevis]